MTDTTNHAEVIRKALLRSDIDNLDYETASDALDALTRDLAETKAAADASQAAFDADLEAGRADLHATIAAQAERIKALEEALDLHENKTHLYPGQHNFRFHVISHDSWDATPAAHKWLDGIRATSEREERERIIQLLTGDRLRVQIDSSFGWATIASEGILREELAALAPKEAQG